MSNPRRMELPVLEWLRNYEKEWLPADLVAGLSTAAVVVPKAMAYATIAGLPVQVGLYTAFVPLVIYALVGTSRPLSVTTTTTIAILAGAQLGAVAPHGEPAALLAASATLTFAVGTFLVAASLLRLGFLANFISEPVLVGFKAAVGLVIVVDQIPKLLGIHFEKGTFVENLGRLGMSLPQASLPTLGLALVILVLLISVERFLPRIPAPLIAVAAGIAGVGLLAIPVETVGQVPRGLPQFFAPDLHLAAQIWPGALGIALMSFTETIAAGRAFARSDEPPLRPNQELVATGLANMGGALFGAMAGGGGTSQTAVNRGAGARTQLAGSITALVALVTMLFLAPLLGLLPQATLAAVVIVYSIGLIRPQEFRVILAVRRMEFLWAITAFLGVVVLGTLKGILVAIVVSLVALAHQVADPPVYALGRKRGTNVFRPRSDEHSEDETFPGLLLARLEGRIFFVNAERIGHKLKALMEEAQPKVLVLDLSSAPDLEYTALKMLTEAEERQRAHGVSLWLVGLNPGVLAVVQRSPLGLRLGHERMHFNLEIAVEKYLSETR
jgi:sulfate permease, SulP family